MKISHIYMNINNITDQLDDAQKNRDSSSKTRRQPPLRTESGDSKFIGEVDEKADGLTRNIRPAQKANIVESRRSRQRRSNGSYRLGNESSTGHNDGGIGLMPMDAMGTLKTIHSRYSGVTGDDFLQVDQNAQEGSHHLKKPPLGQKSRLTEENATSGRRTGRQEMDSSNPEHYESEVSSGDGHSRDEQGNDCGEEGSSEGPTSHGGAIPRPTATGHVHKPRPVSHRKHHAKPVPPPAGPHRNSPNRGPGEPAGGLKRGGKGGVANASAKSLVSNKSFLGASFFNMSFLLTKPHPSPTAGEDVENHEDKSLVTAAIPQLDTERYPTNESALRRMATFYGAKKAGLSHGLALNSHLHPAAAGASFMLPSRPHAPNLSPSDRYRQNAVSRALSMQYSSIEEYGLEFPPDCGPTLDDKILSYQYAMRVAAFNHAGQVDSDGITFIQHPLNSDFGWFAHPLQSLFGNDKPDCVVLEKYGIGMTLWFKFLVSFT
jgi:hypothetical protein